MTSYTSSSKSFIIYRNLHIVMQRISSMFSYVSLDSDSFMGNITAEERKQQVSYLLLVLSLPIVIMCYLILMIEIPANSESCLQIIFNTTLPASSAIICILCYCFPNLKAYGGVLMLIVFSYIMSHQITKDTNILWGL